MNRVEEASAAPLARRLGAAGPRLGGGTGRDEAPPQRAIWRSRRVAYLKLMLPAVALLIVTLILAWPQIMRDDNRVRVGGGGRITAEDADTLRMINARYVGVDDQQRPYVITSALASRDSAHAPTTDLKTPKADMTTSSGSWIAVTAENGVYHNEAKLLDLKGDVSVFHDGGTEFHTATARVELSAGNAAGDDPVDGQGPTMSIKSEGFRIYDRGARIVYTGRAHLVLYQGQRQ